MNTTTKQLHDLRGQQLKALYENCMPMPEYDRLIVLRYADLSGKHWDTRNLSDKALEEIDTLAGKYLERVS